MNTTDFRRFAKATLVVAPAGILLSCGIQPAQAYVTFQPFQYQSTNASNTYPLINGSSAGWTYKCYVQYSGLLDTTYSTDNLPSGVAPRHTYYSFSDGSTYTSTLVGRTDVPQCDPNFLHIQVTKN